MIKYEKGDILEDIGLDLVMIPVNCEGVHGAGLAKEWAEKHPAQAKLYRAICTNTYRQLEQGGDLTIVGNFILFATKTKWKNKSTLKYITRGMKKLYDTLENFDMTGNITIRIPKLGCGCGGLEWPAVKYIIENEILSIDSDREANEQGVITWVIYE